MVSWHGKQVLITGGAGFIGSNLADHLVQRGCELVIYDNLSRKGTEKNLAWLTERHGGRFQFVEGDVRDHVALRSVVEHQDVIFHLAGQVAVTSSVADPRTDFEVNALGTLNLLEAARLSSSDPIVLYASTNKVYGGMTDVAIVESESRYEYADYVEGISESRRLDFHSPYGCSKGAGDQYTIDYARIYGLPTLTFRQSCIYGERQFGNEDQGWLAHFLISSVLGRPITVFGDGKQVRDILHVEDLIRAFELAIEHIGVTRGQAYNIGGGPSNSVSIWAEFGEIMADLLGVEIEVAYADWRPGDQKVYISNITKAKRDFGWCPRVSPAQGISGVLDWILTNKDLFTEQGTNREPHTRFDPLSTAGCH